MEFCCLTTILFVFLKTYFFHVFKVKYQTLKIIVDMVLKPCDFSVFLGKI